MIGNTHGKRIILPCTECRAFVTTMAPATHSAPYSQLAKTERTIHASPPAISVFITRNFTGHRCRPRDRGRIAWAIGGREPFTRQTGIAPAGHGAFTTLSDRLTPDSTPLRV